MSTPASVIVDIQIATNDDNVPSEEEFRQWVSAALPKKKQNNEITIRIVGFNESQSLNANYRGKDAPTNVLSFPSDIPAELEIPFLGDLVICAPLVEQEAREQNKTLRAHWAHLVVHGTLHLLGYDHIEDTEAEAMETLETKVLVGLKFAPPYDN